MATVDDLREPFPNLIHTIRANHPDSSGEYRAARAELDARLALASEGMARRLVWATWALVAATIGVVLATIGLIVVTFHE
jgi:hypothetical protein